MEVDSLDINLGFYHSVLWAYCAVSFVLYSVLLPFLSLVHVVSAHTELTQKNRENIICISEHV